MALSFGLSLSLSLLPRAACQPLSQWDGAAWGRGSRPHGRCFGTDGTAASRSGRRRCSARRTARGRARVKVPETAVRLAGPGLDCGARLPRWWLSCGARAIHDPLMRIFEVEVVSAARDRRGESSKAQLDWPALGGDCGARRLRWWISCFARVIHDLLMRILRPYWCLRVAIGGARAAKPSSAGELPGATAAPDGRVGSCYASRARFTTRSCGI